MTPSPRLCLLFTALGLAACFPDPLVREDVALDSTSAVDSTSTEPDTASSSPDTEVSQDGEPTDTGAPGCAQPSDCAHLDAVCYQGVCGDDGQCVAEALTGTPCDDGVSCTTNDRCDAGVCGGAQLVCDDDVACTVDACDEAMGECVFTPTDQCECQHDSDCADPFICNGAELCHPQTYTCAPSTANAPDGTSCDDGLVCTEGDHCEDGICAGSDVVCAADKPCQTASCVEEGLQGCVLDSSACQCVTDDDCPLKPCFDGVLCNENGECEDLDPVVCPPSNVECMVSYCDTQLNSCELHSAADGTSCDDGDACSATDRCHSGACRGYDWTTCAPLTQCHAAGTCDADTGQCSTPLAPVDTACDAGDGQPGFCRQAECKPRSVTVGFGGTCLVVHGEVRCWGGSDDTAADGEHWVFPGRDVAEAGAGFGYKCLRFVDGGVRCWGLSEIEIPMLGYGSIAHSASDPTASPDLPLGAPATDISVAPGHVCAVLNTGGLRCWGVNQEGALGLGTDDDVGDDESAGDVPLVDVGVPVSAVTAGIKHTCVLTSTQRVRCWGSHSLGRLGYPGVTENIGDDESPATAGDVPLTVLLAHVAAGLSHTCAVTPSGSVRCWGKLDEELDGIKSVDLAAQAIDITSGRRASCALLSSGGIKCWGSGWAGVLGYENTNDVGILYADTQPLVSIGGTAAAITMHDQWSGGMTCALLNTGALKCWGNDGMLGYGDDVHYGASAGTMPPPDVPFE